MPHPKLGYRIDGCKVPGVTTILGRFKDSGGLMYWAFEQGKAAERGEIATLYESRDAAAEAGTLAHAMVQAHQDWGPMPVKEDYLFDIWTQAEKGFKNYLTWAENTKIQVVHQEVEFVSRQFRYGGCIDAIGRDSQGRLCMIDWKTSNAIYPDYLCQVVAYQRGWDEVNSTTPITGGFHLCRFSKDHADFSHHYWENLDEAWELFKLYRLAYDIDKQLKRRV